MLYLCFFKPSRNYLRGVLDGSPAGTKTAEYLIVVTHFYIPYPHGQYSFARIKRTLFQASRKKEDHPRGCGEK